MNILNLIEKCMLPSLSKPYDEASDHIEFNVYKQNILANLQILKSHLFDSETQESVICSSVKTNIYSSIIILIEELKVKRQWYVDNQHSFTSFLSTWMANTEGKEFDSLLNSRFEGGETVYLACVRKLHEKLNRKTWMYYPLAVGCYRSVIKYLDIYHVHECSLSLVIPAALLLMDDYRTENKIVGLECCTTLLMFNAKYNADNFGYEKVIYDSLLKHLRFRDNEVLFHTVECIIVLLPSLRLQDAVHSSKWTDIDEIINILLDDLYVESDLTKKKLLLKCLKEAFKASGVSCIRWTEKYLQITTDIFEGFMDKNHMDMLLVESMDCFMEWLKFGWTTFSYTQKRKLIRILLKVMYILSSEKANEENAHIKRIMEFITVLCSLCTTNNKMQLKEELDNGTKHFENYVEFFKYLETIKCICS